MNIMASLVAFVGLAANVISLAIPYWMYIKNENDGIVIPCHEGLWKRCVKTLGTSVCSDISDSADWLKAVRAFMIIGAVCLAIGSVIACDGLKLKDNLESYGYAVAIGGVCCIVAVIIYGSKIPHDSVTNFHAGFWLAVAIGVVSIIRGGMLVRASNASTEYSSI